MKNEEKNNHRWNTVIEVRTLFLLISEKKFKHPNLNFASNRMKRSRCKWFDIYFLCLSLCFFLLLPSISFSFVCPGATDAEQNQIKMGKKNTQKRTGKLEEQKVEGETVEPFETGEIETGKT